MLHSPTSPSSAPPPEVEGKFPLCGDQYPILCTALSLEQLPSGSISETEKKSRRRAYWLEAFRDGDEYLRVLKEMLTHPEKLTPAARSATEKMVFLLTHFKESRSEHGPAALDSDHFIEEIETAYESYDADIAPDGRTLSYTFKVRDPSDVNSK